MLRRHQPPAHTWHLSAIICRSHRIQPPHRTARPVRRVRCVRVDAVPSRSALIASIAVTERYLLRSCDDVEAVAYVRYERLDQPTHLFDRYHTAANRDSPVHACGEDSRIACVERLRQLHAATCGEVVRSNPLRIFIGNHVTPPVSIVDGISFPHLAVDVSPFLEVSMTSSFIAISSENARKL